MQIDFVRISTTGKLESVELNTPVTFQAKYYLDNFKESKRIFRIKTASSDMLVLEPLGGLMLDISSVWQKENASWQIVVEPISTETLYKLQNYAKTRPWLELPEIIYQISEKIYTQFSIEDLEH